MTPGGIFNDRGRMAQQTGMSKRGRNVSKKGPLALMFGELKKNSEKTLNGCLFDFGDGRPIVSSLATPSRYG